MLARLAKRSGSQTHLDCPTNFGFSLVHKILPPFLLEARMISGKPDTTGKRLGQHRFFESSVLMA